ncbi:TRAP transporter large permease [Photobacterium sp. DNB23_23_1]|uniref:TRAP transporter large permease protein n=1 Tax=Photobacterium pectinilyticum TaxID=2906793 RepID=A0ABT1N2C9_9GAMM|nr:TRAP transporter large permease [Photobacterium sp. ZSDE20]MCQ1058893.1 TRAP transporter large permease [Photobacterium sp. ZSDE20]MDD1823817.1 TRAP transporter large permease [Photobacterium sp. ZSDE20]
MDFLTAGVLCIALLLALMAVGLQIGLSFILSGFIICSLLLDFDSSISLLGQASYFSIATPTWASIPLFILMGSFAASSGLAQRAYTAIYAMSTGIRGSLGIATCFSCAAFGAVSGSSLATTAIFGKMALPEMNRLSYNKAFSAGCIASAGTFASMIPPSMMMIVYALFTQQSVAKLFAAGVVPGILTAVGYVVIIQIVLKRHPDWAPMPDTIKQHKAELRTKRFKEATQIWPVIIIATVVLGGIYSGWFTPTEAAAAGALITLILGWSLGSFRNVSNVIDAMKESANTTAMLFLINIGALFFSRTLAITRLPVEITMMLNELSMPPIVILLGIMAIMLLLGMIMVPVGIYALLLPIVFPLITSLGYDPIWFGVIALKITEIGSITPPVGLNVFAMKGVIPKEMNISLEDIFKGVWPFLICELIVLTLLVVFPQLSLWLPNLLLG